MKQQIFATEGETRQGTTVQLVISFVHGLYDSQPAQEVQGFIEAFTSSGHFRSDLNKKALNQEVVWDLKYLKLIGKAFGQVKERTLSLEENTLSITVQLNKGIKLTILTFVLEEQQTSSFDGMVSSFIKVNTHLQCTIKQEKQRLKEVADRNQMARSQLVRIQQSAAHEMDCIKDQFVKIINQVKLKIRTLLKEDLGSEETTTEKLEASKVQEKGSLINEEIVRLLF